MGEAWRYRFMEPADEVGVRRLVLRVFDEFIAPRYSQEGIREFRDYVQPDLLARRSQTNHFVLLATHVDRFVGMIEMRECGHVSLLFVDGGYQRRGIARELLRRALEACRERGHEPREVTVNSSPNSVAVYERLGFRPKGPEQLVNGIRFTPMVLSLTGVTREPFESDEDYRSGNR